MLHLIFHTPIDTNLLERIGSQDTIVFMDNAVLALLKHSTFSKVLANLTHHSCYALLEDLQIRGINPEELSAHIQVINYTQLVELTVANSVIQSWS
jgi:sulfur relay protein TusB/DsrH